MLDVAVFGLRPGPLHVTNLLLHLCSSIVLFMALTRMTGATGRSAFVAALFALDPLHVESVAWIAERKDVLSTPFWMLTLWAWAGWAVAGRRGGYWLALVFFALGLMAKPMLVTLPVTLLLLDVWPLGRAVLNGPRLADGWRASRVGPAVAGKDPVSCAGRGVRRRGRCRRGIGCRRPRGAAGLDARGECAVGLCHVHR